MITYLVHPEVAKVMLNSGTPYRAVQEGNDVADKSWEQRCEEIAGDNIVSDEKLPSQVLPV